MSRWICSHPKERSSACSLVFCGDEEELKLGLDSPRLRGAHLLAEVSKTHKLAQALTNFFSLIPTSNCSQMNDAVDMNPDVVPRANKVACNIYLQLGRNTRRESRCEWL